MTGDVPTAGKNSFEWYIGGRYQESETGKPARLLPFTELVYGLTDQQELTFEIAGLSRDHEYGINDAVIGTKFIFLKETERRPGIAGSFELKLPTGDESRGLGSGEFDYDLRLRAQKTWGWFTGIGNVGYTFVTDPEFGGVTTSSENVWLLTFGQEYQIAKRTKLLSEIYFVSRDEPSAPNRLAANIGFKHNLRDNLTVHAAVGKSIREANRGGPDVRVYVGCSFNETSAPAKYVVSVRCDERPQFRPRLHHVAERFEVSQLHRRPIPAHGQDFAQAGVPSSVTRFGGFQHRAKQFRGRTSDNVTARSSFDFIQRHS